MSITRDAFSSWILLPVAFVLATSRPAVAETCVGVDLRFSGTAPSRPLVQSMQQETEAIWGAYDVRVLWSALPGADVCAALSASFDAVVDEEPAPAALPLTLGSTHVVSPRLGRIPILMHRRAAEELIQSLSAVEVTRLAGHPTPGPDDIGRALGRVLAHEIGHVLLGAPDHRPSGLMRAAFRPHELVARQRQWYTLSGIELRRLRQRECVLDTGADCLASHQGFIGDDAAGLELIVERRPQRPACPREP